MPGSDPQQTFVAASVACSLDAGGLRTQEQRWTQLMSNAGTGRTATATGVALTFRAEPLVERQLRELVAVENNCCAWAHWEVEAGGKADRDRAGELVMHARTIGNGIAVLQSMFLHGT
jgi:hypothetical protein